MDEENPRPSFSGPARFCKNPRPITPIQWAVLLRLSLRSVFVCHKHGPMVENTMCSIGPEVRIEENRLSSVSLEHPERGV